MSAPAALETEPDEAFLAAVADPRRRTLPFRTTLVVAHPDDETIGCGALLPRLADVMIIHVTDGAPRNLADANARGFSTAEAYAAARRSELEAAMQLAGVSADRLIAYGCPDQESGDRLAGIARGLARLLAGRNIVLTHSYEGGHPDHDATAFAVHAACRLLGSRAPAIIEMPLYRAGPDGWLVQSFATGGADPETVVTLAPAERTRKQAMLAAYGSQRQVLERFGIKAERFRRAPDYDFAVLPNEGILLYEGQNWGMSGAGWLERSHAALAELGLAQP